MDILNRPPSLLQDTDPTVRSTCLIQRIVKAWTITAKHAVKNVTRITASQTFIIKRSAW